MVCFWGTSGLFELLLGDELLSFFFSSTSHEALCFRGLSFTDDGVAEEFDCLLLGAFLFLLGLAPAGSVSSFDDVTEADRTFDEREAEELLCEGG